MPLLLNSAFSSNSLCQWGASLLGLIAALSYNGAYGNKKLGRLLYGFYPLHLALLAVFRIAKCIR